MLSKVRIGTHPLHPILILIPAGAFVNVLILDIVYLISGSTPWWQATPPLLLVGVIGGLVAAIPGFVDFLTVVRAQNAQGPAAVHGILNVLVVAIFAWNTVVRWTAEVPPGRASLGFWLTIVGSALLAVAGWFGWKLVQEYHVGVLEHPQAKDRPPDELRRREAAD